MSEKRSRKRTFTQMCDDDECKQKEIPAKKMKLKHTNSMQTKKLIMQKDAQSKNVVFESKNLLSNIKERVVQPKCVVRIIFKSITKELQVRGKKSTSFWAIIMDQANNLMKIAFYGDACLKHHFLETGKVYSIANATVKRNEHEGFASIKLICNDSTEIFSLADTNVIGKQNWNIIESIKTIRMLQKEKIIDVIGVISRLSTIEKVQTRKGDVVSKRTFELMDPTARIHVTVWEELTFIPLKEKQIIGIKRAKVTDWKALSLTVIGFIETQPQHATVGKLQGLASLNAENFCKRVQATKSISEEDENREEKSMQSMQVSEVIEEIEAFKNNQLMPATKCFKIQARIKQSRSSKLWYRKEQDYHWRFFLTIQSLKDPSKCFQAVCFPEGASGITQEFTANDAAKLQSKDSKKFCETMEQILSSDKEYTFWCQFTKNCFFGTPKLDVKIVKSILE